MPPRLQQLLDAIRSDHVSATNLCALLGHDDAQERFGGNDDYMSDLSDLIEPSIGLGAAQAWSWCVVRGDDVSANMIVDHIRARFNHEAQETACGQIIRHAHQMGCLPAAVPALDAIIGPPATTKEPTQQQQAWETKARGVLLSLMQHCAAEHANIAPMMPIVRTILAADEKMTIEMLLSCIKAHEGSVSVVRAVVHEGLLSEVSRAHIDAHVVMRKNDVGDKQLFDAATQHELRAGLSISDYERAGNIHHHPWVGLHNSLKTARGTNGKGRSHRTLLDNAKKGVFGPDLEVLGCLLQRCPNDPVPDKWADLAQWVQECPILKSQVARRQIQDNVSETALPSRPSLKM